MRERRGFVAVIDWLVGEIVGSGWWGGSGEWVGRKAVEGWWGCALRLSPWSWLCSHNFWHWTQAACSRLQDIPSVLHWLSLTVQYTLYSSYRPAWSRRGAVIHKKGTKTFCPMDALWHQLFHHWVLSVRQVTVECLDLRQSAEYSHRAALCVPCMLCGAQLLHEWGISGRIFSSFSLHKIYSVEDLV